MKRYTQNLICRTVALALFFLVGLGNFTHGQVSDSTDTSDSKAYTSTSDTGDTISLNDKAVASAAPVVSDVQRDSEIDKPTHRQSEKIVPMLDGKPIKLNTFCMANDGTILAACGGKQATYKINDEGGYETVELDEPCVLIQMNSKGEVLNRWDLEFKPSAVNVAPNDDIFVAGSGQIARISNGKVVAKGSAPHINDIEEFKTKAIEQAKKQMEQFAEMMKKELESLKERIAKIEEVEEEERSRIQKALLQAFKQQVEYYENAGDMGMGRQEPEAIVARAMEITSIAVSEQDVFWVCNQVQGHGYAIWRTDHEFNEGKEVMDGVSGCCGQMDIQCCDNNLVIAQNTSYKVSIYDRDGEELSSFGSRDRSSKSGFGSCCNPMNVRALADGTILTAESSIGHIKRFDQEGKFLEYVGKAKVAGGCKHCALGYDSKSDQYYMMHQDDSVILVLANRSSLPDQTEDELRVARLKDKFEARLVGTWELEGDKEKEKDKEVEAKEEEETESGAVAFVMETQDAPFKTFNFHPDGKLEVTGGYANGQSDWSWVPVKGENDELTVSILSDQVEMMPVSITFGKENNASFEIRDFTGTKTTKATRVKGCDGKSCEDTCDEEQKPGKGSN